MLNAKKYQLGLFMVLSESFSYLAFQNMLQIDLSRFVTTFTELRQRKTDQTLPEVLDHIGILILHHWYFN